MGAAEAETFRKNGDHLLAKEDWDGALAQYIAGLRATGGATGTAAGGEPSPSYVIRQFLKVAQIRNLAVYLEAVHNASLATAEHTSLLLSCYLQLKVSSGRVYDAFQTTVRVKRKGCLDTEADRVAFVRSEKALRTLLSDASLDTKVDEQVSPAVSHVVALRTMAQTSDGNFCSVKDYVARAMVDETRGLRSIQKFVHSLSRDVQIARSQLQELRRMSHIFQNGRCSGCSQSLGLPAVHFFCLHNYHAACDKEGFCGKCSSPVGF
jgi:hypothetical protein